MRLERTGPQFRAENQRMVSDILARTATTAFTSPPAIVGAQHVVEVEHEYLDHRPSGKRNDPTDTRPFLRSVMSEQRWGPRPALPDPKAAVDAMREQIQARIGELLTARANAMAGGPIEQELRALQQRLDVLPK